MAVKSNAIKVGDSFDYFGEIWTVTRLHKIGSKSVREVDMRRDSLDSFGGNVPEFRSFHVSALDVMRKLPKEQRNRAGSRRSKSRNRAEGRMYYPDYADAIKQQIYKGMDSWFGAVRLVEARMQTGELRNWFDSGVPVDAAVERIVNNYQEPEKGPEYGGEPMPKWVKEGARVRVKATPWLRQYGIRTTAGVSHSSDDRAWPGDVGVIRRTDRQSWHWYVQFERGRETGLDIETLDKLVRVKA